MDKNPQQENEQKPGKAEHTEVFLAIRRVTGWVMIMSAILFALVGILAIWEVFGDNAGDIVWRAFSSLAIIAFAALVINVASRIMMSKQ